MAYLGNKPSDPVSGPAIVTTQTATASQTSFTVSGGYTPSFIDVYQNGVRLIPTTDYTATTGTTVVLTTGASLNDELMFVAYQTAQVGSIAQSYSAINLSGGSANQIPYQTAAGTTSMTNVKTINSTSLLASGDISTRPQSDTTTLAQIYAANLLF